MRTAASSRFTIACCLALFSGGVVAMNSNASSPDDQRKAAVLVQQALQEEAAGKSSEREQSLSAALEQARGYEPAMWHKGFVKLDGKWVKYDEVPQALAGRANLAAYRIAREKYPETIGGQFELANWCAKRKLAEQERAHLTKVVELDPDHGEARHRLDFEKVGVDWLSKQQIEQSKRDVANTAGAMKKWLPRVETIGRGFRRRSPQQREAAAQQLRAINDPASIPALESAVSAVNVDAAQAVVDTVGEMPGTQASQSLARQAVFGKWLESRTAAAQALRHRDEQTYMPVLLAALATPVQSKAQLYATADGRLLYSHSFFREGQERKELATMMTSFESADGTDPSILGLPAAQEAALAREAVVARQNEFTRQLNERICTALAEATGLGFGDSPEAWWNWWNAHNEVYMSGDKPTVQTYRYEQVAVATTPPSEGTMDCLAAGTPVWTETGLVAIEKIRVGDRVLSQHPETGELAYRPVLRTTVRPSGPLVELGVGSEVIRTSGGHPLWVAGQGWLKARKIQPGMLLHSTTGATSTRSAVLNGREETYNLVVADFHTYFVGQTKVLSHDNTVRQPTTATVPGLVAAEVSAAPAGKK